MARTMRANGPKDCSVARVALSCLMDASRKVSFATISSKVRPEDLTTRKYQPFKRKMRTRKSAMTLNKRTTFHHRFSVRSHKLLQVQVRQSKAILQRSNISYQSNLAAMTRKRAKVMTMKERCGRWATRASLSPYKTAHRLQLTRCTLIT